MKVRFLFFASTLLTALLVSAVRFNSQLHVFQCFANQLYEKDMEKQREAVKTLLYLFRNVEWTHSWRWERLSEFLRSGGLNGFSSCKLFLKDLTAFCIPLTLRANFRGLARNEVLVADALAHFTRDTYYELPGTLRPQLEKLIQKYGKQVKQYNKNLQVEDWLLLVTPPSVGTTSAEAPLSLLDPLKGLPHPKTVGS
ncbi:uncharacterized protein SPSC_06634 [Sporisorium scitamineum]|uniref:Uncharacterized protein n=1 Tax=Sporisorium scitamineum TaxID=49012 RepID=A0A140KNR5_9BASI|nr:uncharacterized protein SPSC_06634 [Sporisorium scitamineum]